jgi:hypothetical protein
MVNAIASSDYSLASTLLEWRPTTWQYTDRYLSIAYADDIDGTGFDLNPRGKLYYGYFNTSSTSPSSNPADYAGTWTLADPAFGTNIYLIYCNRQNYKFSFDTDFATYASGSGAFVPTTTANFDPKIWSALPDGTNIIDLRPSTGQFLGVGNTTTGTVQNKITNTNDGQLIAHFERFVNSQIKEDRIQIFLSALPHRVDVLTPPCKHKSAYLHMVKVKVNVLNQQIKLFIWTE